MHVRPVAWSLAALALVPFAFAQAPAAAAPAVARELHGRIEDLGGIKLLRVWGTPQERGYAHGALLAKEVASAAIAEFTARFGGDEQKKLLELARGAVDRLIEYPADVQTEIEALFQALVDSKVDLTMPALGRAFDLTDLRVANALDVFGLMGCSGFTVWGDQVDGGGVLTGRNFDWPFTGPHLLDGTILLVEQLADGRAVCSVTWPGYVGTVTGVDSDGVAVFLHVGSGKISRTPEPSSWPTAIAARRILEELRPADPKAAFTKAKDLLGYTSPPAGFLTRVVLPIVPKEGTPAAVFETDTKQCVLADAQACPCVVTNHFETRKDGRVASKDSLDRAMKVRAGVDGCIADGDHKVSIAEAWTVLESVQRGNQRFGTLHAIVFRHEPWCFELRLGTQGEKGCVPAPVSTRRFALTREQVFGKDVPGRK
jgi:hypothetical protein